MTPVGPVTFTVWSDVLCPWCYVTALRLEEVRHAAGDALRVEWRAFLLRPNPESRSIERFREYSESWRRPAEAEPRADFHVWDTDTPPPSYSVPPAVACKVARSFGSDAFDRFHLALMRAYFVENRTVSDHDVALDVARSVDLDATEFAVRLDSLGPACSDAVADDHEGALRRGITAVPTVVVEDEYVLTGAMSVEQYSRVVARLGS